MTTLDIQERIGENVRRFRIMRHLTQEQLAEAVGISTSFCTNIERGKKRPGLRVLVSLADALSVSTDALLSDVKDSTVEEAASNAAALIRKMTPDGAKRAERLLQFLIVEEIC